VPLQVPQQGPYGESCPFTRLFFNISLIPHKISLNKELFSLFSKTLGKGCPSKFPTGPLWKELPVYNTFFNIYQIPHKISLNKGIFPFLKDPRKGVSLQVPNRAPMERAARLQDFFF